MLIGTTCLRHQKNLLGKIRHFSDMKHQIELYSGLLEASQHAAAGFGDPERADQYVEETFTRIRDRLLLSRPQFTSLSEGKQATDDLGTNQVLSLLNKIIDIYGRKT